MSCINIDPHGHGGLTALEVAILAEWDGGLSVKRIALKLNCPPRRVESTISNYDGKADHAFAVRDAKQGSAQLLAAIARHHPERIAA
ncbi:hypothetical protein [Sphingopyxis granuli]|uniref:hypothetical protein n=1 Tax=Sphingopyxis granuli TaxID=267128 RepID=UPI001BAF9683|nr:hypothetical protein [Sphingopyxis granuli]QUM73320.1 hypothetical protein ICN83_05390 [Sphingopyxis granuli]